MHREVITFTATSLSPNPLYEFMDEFHALAEKWNSTERVSVVVHDAKQLESKITGSDLSLRERQVLWHLREAKCNKEIAHKLNISEGTVKTHVQKVFRKLGIRHRTQIFLLSEESLAQYRITSGELVAGEV